MRQVRRVFLLRESSKASEFQPLVKETASKERIGQSMEFTAESIITITIISWFIIKVLLGYKRGLTKIAAGVLIPIIAFFGAGLLSPIINAIFSHYGVYELVSGLVEDFIAAQTTDNIDLAELSSLAEPTNAFLTAKASMISARIVSTMVYLIGYCAIAVVLKIAVDIAEIVTRLPIIDECDRTLGAVCAFFATLVQLWLIVAIIKQLTFVEPINTAYTVLVSTKVGAFLASFNPLPIILSLLSKAKEVSINVKEYIPTAP